MWYGSLYEPNSKLSTDKKFLATANKYMKGGRILLSHANTTIGPRNFVKLHNIIKKRHLKTVLIKDVIK
jgi:hypothetical protein